MEIPLTIPSGFCGCEKISLQDFAPPRGQFYKKDVSPGTLVE
jgi:hypothetical protein